MTGGGWAAGIGPRRQLLSYVPFGDEDDEPAYAIADAWESLHPLAVPDDLCDRLVAVAQRTPPAARGNGEYRIVDPEPVDRDAIVNRFREANAIWWQLDLDRWDVHVKRYGVGDRHTRHQDLHARAARRKLAGSVQLSDPGAYEGGDLVVHFAGQRIPMPRARGALVVFPGWTVHEIEAVTAGERWALIVNGWGPPLR